MRRPPDEKRRPARGGARDHCGGDRSIPYLIHPRPASAPEKPTLEALASRAFEDHTSLARIETGSPELRQSPFWQVLRRAAFARFTHAFEVLVAAEPHR